MSTVDTSRIEATVSGHVQGVSFRHYTLLEARRLSLVGWVANQPDGTVRVVAEGPASALEALLAFLRRGSPAARVDVVDVNWSTATGTFTEFRVHH